jgi:surface polysaccharide O-acyltransferase-like enzyme
MIYFLWFPFAMAVGCFVCTLVNLHIPAAQKKHTLAISVGYGALAAAVAQPIHDVRSYVVPGVLALMACSRFIWEAAEWQKSQTVQVVE